MGRDGARGLTALKHDGAVTVAQDEDSCVIFGMPKEAIRMGGASFVGNIEEIRELIFKSICGEKRGRAA
jgi:two-component system chemotaxis response regulator CheB